MRWAWLLLVSLASCSADAGGVNMPRCSAWIILHGAADLHLDCPAAPPAKPLQPAPVKPAPKR
jgi:hypothetical protein